MFSAVKPTNQLTARSAGEAAAISFALGRRVLSFWIPSAFLAGLLARLDGILLNLAICGVSTWGPISSIWIWDGWHGLPAVV